MYRWQYQWQSKWDKIFTPEDEFTMIDGSPPPWVKKAKEGGAEKQEKQETASASENAVNEDEQNDEGGDNAN